MANAKDIRGQIKSIGSTQKITKAMEMVAASKMRRAQENMRRGRPYAENILRVMAHVANASSEQTHPLMQERTDVKAVGYLIVSTDRGLCGGLNFNLFRKVLQHICEQEKREVFVSIIGRTGVTFFSRLNCKIVATVEHYGDNPSLSDLIGSIHPLLDLYQEGKIDRVYIAANQFINNMTQQPEIGQLLPAVMLSDKAKAPPSYPWDYIYEPSAGEILKVLVVRYVESLVRQATAENIASEMSARMIAMKNASDNAGNLIDELELKYNKARQAAITQELTEIVAGAAAV